jgi:hypothetical protein
MSQARLRNSNVVQNKKTMSLPTTYTQAFNLLPEFFNTIRDAQAPPKFTNQLLKDMGYESSNHRAFVPILKSLGFLSADGTPTQRYHDYRNHALSKKIMGKAIKEAYSDIFLIKANPTNSDKALIEGKFKSFHNASDIVASLMAKTFYALLGIADLTLEEPPSSAFMNLSEKAQKDQNVKEENQLRQGIVGLHYDIQIHLPATKDLEVYNAIFKSLKDHLLE